MEIQRLDWDSYYMGLAMYAANQTTCTRRACGAVLVRDQRVLATGFNGSPSGVKHCAEVGCLRRQMNIPSGERHELCRAVHAEQNAILQCAIHGVSVHGATLYSTNQPCSMCAKEIIQVGIKRVYYSNPYPDELAMVLFAESEVVIIKVPAVEIVVGHQLDNNPCPAVNIGDTVGFGNTTLGELVDIKENSAYIRVHNGSINFTCKWSSLHKLHKVENS